MQPENLLSYKNQISSFFQYTDLQSQSWSSYYPSFGSCCHEFRANLCSDTREHSVQTADDNRKVISQAF